MLNRCSGARRSQATPPGSALRTNALLPALQLRLGSRCQAEGSRKQKDECNRRACGEECGGKLPWPPPPERWGEASEPQDGRQHDHCIEAGALPVIAVQVQPHPEFVECEAETYPVDHGGRRGRWTGAEQQVRLDP